MRNWAAVFALLFAPTFACAASAAGFAPGSLWLSEQAPMAGDAVKVYTVLYDSGASPLSGDVQFNVDSGPLQTVHFSLAPGETQIVSADWTASIGEHSFSAALENVSGPSGALAQASTGTVSVTVKAAPPSPIARYAAIVQNAVASSSPVVQSIFQAIASTTENWRAAGSRHLSAALVADAKRTAAAAGPAPLMPEVLGASTTNLAAAGSASPGGTLEKVRTGVLRALLYVFQMPILFYAALAIVLYTIYKLLRALLSERAHHAR